MALASTLSKPEADLIMEQLRQRAGNVSSWNDLIAAARTNMREKRNPMDGDDRESLRKGLESLQKSKKVITSTGLIEQLKNLVALKCGLKFVSQNPNSIFLSTDYYYIEIKGNSDNGIVEEVFLFHGNLKAEDASGLVLKEMINEGRWEDLIKELKGLNRFYPEDYSLSDKIETPKKLEVFKSLMNLEKDIYSLQFPYSKVDKDSLLDFLASSCGYIKQRRAGTPMTLNFFASPYDFLDLNQNAFAPLNLQNHTANVPSCEIIVKLSETGTALQTKSLIKQKSKRGFVPLANDNSHIFPATFLLSFSTPIVLLKKAVSSIEKITGASISLESEEKCKNLIGCVIGDKTAGENGLTVAVKDDFHRYFIEEEGHSHLTAVQLREIPFSHPDHVVQVLEIVKQSYLLNTILLSCVRNNKNNAEKLPKISNDDSEIPVQLTVVRKDCIEAVVQSPTESASFLKVRFNFDSFDTMMVNVEMIGSDNCKEKCSEAEKKGTYVFQMSWSIPVTLRSILKRMGWDYKKLNGNSNGENNGNKKVPKFEPDDHQEDSSKYEDESNNKDGRKDENWIDKMSGKDKFFMSNQPNVKEGGKRSAWLPSKDSKLYSCYASRYAQTEKIQYSVEGVGDPKNPPNLLDLFKEITVVKELIPPYPNQPPLKSPTPVTPQNSKIHEVLGAFPPQIPLPQPPQPQNTIKMTSRHASSSSDTLVELDNLAQLSKSLSGPEQTSSLSSERMRPGQPPIKTEPSPMASMETMSPSSTVGVGSMSAIPSVSSPHSFTAQPHHPSQSIPPPVSTAPSSAGIFPQPGRDRPAFMQSRSFDTVMMHPPNTPGPPSNFSPSTMYPQTARHNMGRGMEEFDFEKSDPIEAGMGSVVNMGAMSAGPQSFMANPGNNQSAFPFTGLPASGPGSRGGKIRGQGGRGRRSKKLPGNLGDRPLSTDDPMTLPVKKRGPTGTRRPRKPRGASLTGVPSPLTPNLNLNQNTPSPAFSLNDAVQPPKLSQVQQGSVQPVPTSSTPSPLTSVPFHDLSPTKVSGPGFPKLGGPFPPSTTPTSGTPPSNLTPPTLPPSSAASGSGSIAAAAPRQPQVSLAGMTGPGNVTAVSTPPNISNITPGPNQLASQQSLDKSGPPVGLEVEDSDESDSQSGDAQLRKQMQEIQYDLEPAAPPPAPPLIMERKGSASPLLEASVKAKRSPQVSVSNLVTSEDRSSAPIESSGNLFENLQNSGAVTISSGNDSPQLSQDKDKTTPPNLQRTKPNILAKNASRKGSLDLVIGKLKEKVGVPGEGSDDEIIEEPSPKKLKAAEASLDSVFGSYTPAEIAQAQSQLSTIGGAERKTSGNLGIESGSSLETATSSPADSEGLKILIKKALIKPSHERSGGNQSGVKQGFQRQRSSDTKAKTGEMKRAREKKKQEKLQSFKTGSEGFPKKRKHDDSKRASGGMESKITSPGPKIPKVQAAEADPFSGSKGIFFSSSLKGFRIPKLQEDTPPPPAQPPPQAPPPAPKPPPIPAKAPGPPILKQPRPSLPRPQQSFPHESSGGPSSQQGGWRPVGRKALLPNPHHETHQAQFTPMQQHGMAHSHPGTGTFSGQQEHVSQSQSQSAAVGAVGAQSAPPAISDTPEEPTADISSQIRSPDDSGFVIEESSSPYGLNISKDSDMSPELSIVTEAEPGDN